MAVLVQYGYFSVTILGFIFAPSTQVKLPSAETSFANCKKTKYSHWLPLNPAERRTRNTSVYKVEKAIGNRLYNSPIYAVRRLLNGSKSQEQVDLSGLFNAL